MRKQLKGLLALGLIACLSVSTSIFAFAGQWQEDAKGRWYQNDDGSYPTNTWKEIDGAYYYFFNDGYTVEPYTFFEGVDFPSNGMGWTPEGNDVNGKENALTIAEDMGLTYGELKAKYGNHDITHIQKFLLLENGARFEYNDTDSSEIFQLLISNEVKDGAQYGRGVWFPNSPIKFQETHIYNLIETTEYVPNYYFLSDIDGNISDDSKPVNITFPIKKIFPSLRPGYEMEEMVGLAEDMGANVISWKSEIVTFNNQWNDGKEESYYYSKIKFELGGYFFYGVGDLQPNVGLDSCFTVRDN